MRRTKYIFKYQSKVVKLLDTPNFIDEHERLPPMYSDFLSFHLLFYFDTRSSFLESFLTYNIDRELKEFKELRVRDIQFSYSPEFPPALDLTGQEILVHTHTQTDTHSLFFFHEIVLTTTYTLNFFFSSFVVLSGDVFSFTVSTGEEVRSDWTQQSRQVNTH